MNRLLALVFIKTHLHAIHQKGMYLPYIFVLGMLAVGCNCSNPTSETKPQPLRRSTGPRNTGPGGASTGTQTTETPNTGIPNTENKPTGTPNTENSTPGNLNTGNPATGSPPTDSPNMGNPNTGNLPTSNPNTAGALSRITDEMIGLFSGSQEVQELAKFFRGLKNGTNNIHEIINTARGLSALDAAVISKSLGLVQILLDAGADINATDDAHGKPHPDPDNIYSPSDNDAVYWCGTPLQFATRHGCLEALQFLLDHNADVNLKTAGSHNTALYLAVRFGQLEALKRLLADKRINVNVENDNKGETALQAAVKLGRLEMVNALLTAPNIDVNHTSVGTQQTPLELAQEAYQKTNKQVYKDIEMALLQKTSQLKAEQT